MKYVPHFVAQTVYVPQVPHVWYSCGTKSSRPPFTLKSSFREGICFFIRFFSRWGKGANEKNDKKDLKSLKIFDFSVLHPTSTLNPQPTSSLLKPSQAPSTDFNPPQPTSTHLGSSVLRVQTPSFILLL